MRTHTVEKLLVVTCTRWKREVLQGMDMDSLGGEALNGVGLRNSQDFTLVTAFSFRVGAEDLPFITTNQLPGFQLGSGPLRENGFSLELLEVSHSRARTGYSGIEEAHFLLCPEILF